MSNRTKKENDAMRARTRLARAATKKVIRLRNAYVLIGSLPQLTTKQVHAADLIVRVFETEMDRNRVDIEKSRYTPEGIFKKQSIKPIDRGCDARKCSKHSYTSRCEFCNLPMNDHESAVET